LEEGHRIGDTRPGVEQSGASLYPLVGVHVETIRAGVRPDATPITEKQPAGARLARLGSASQRRWIAVSHGWFGQGGELAIRAQAPAKMPAPRAGGPAFLGRVPDLDKLQMNRLAESLGQVRQELLRERLHLPPAHAREGQQPQERGGRTAGRQPVPLPEAPRPGGEVVFTIAEVPDVFHQEPFNVHGVNGDEQVWLQRVCHR